MGGYVQLSLLTAHIILSGFCFAGCYDATMTPDGELLRRYAEANSEDAFAELVRRHVDLVHSAALRQVNGDAHLAQDVAQAVFTDLARKAAVLLQRQALTGWLYTSTHFAAAKAVRREHRRHLHEQEAHAMQELFQAPTSDLSWEKLRPMLDKVMHELNESDRAVILMRYFENHSFADIGQSLGLSEDAARKRVDRALEKLRVLFSKRGVGTTVTLGTVLSANAVQTAPAGLASTLTGASLASAAAGSGTALSFLKLMAMTKLQAGIMGTLVVACVLTPLAMQHQAQASAREPDQVLQQEKDRLAQLTADNQRLSNLLAHPNRTPTIANDQFNELLKLRGEIGRLRQQARELAQSQSRNQATGTNALAAKEALWAERVAQLKQWLEQNPSEKIPELQFLSDRDWLNSISGHKLDTPDEFGRAMSTVRANAESLILGRLSRALRTYARNNNGQLPTDLSQLSSYLDSPIDDTILQRYELLPATDLVTNLQGDGDWVITQKAPVNADLDVRIASGLNSGRMADSRVTNRWILVP